MKVILHADDFGYDKDTTEATIELLECGALSSATIMVNMPASKMALEYAAKHPEKSFGVHLTYVDGLLPVKRDKQTRLTDSEKRFFDSAIIRNNALLLKLNRQEIVDESLAQIQVLKDAGVNLSHLDSHGHIHKFPSFQIALADISKKAGVKKIRRVQNVFVEKPHKGPTRILNWVLDKWISMRFKTTDFFYMSANNMDTGWADSILAIMDSLPQSATIEIGVHPGHADTEKERWRIAEYNDIKDFSEKLRISGKHQIITWNEV